MLMFLTWKMLIFNSLVIIYAYVLRGDVPIQLVHERL